MAISSGGIVNVMSDDTDLVRTARENPAAFGLLYERYRDRIYSYLLARTNSEEDAADLTQHVFTRALAALQQYRSHKGSFLTWLFTIARNASNNFLQRRHATVTWDYVPEVLHPLTELEPEAVVLRQEALIRLRTLFNALDQHKRELLTLRFVAGLTAAEIAVVLGKSEAATKKQLTRTLHLLKEQYYDVHE